MQIVFEKLKNLPVISLLGDISAHCKSGGIAIVNSATGSGKTLCVPTRIYQDYIDSGDQILVVEPKRFLAMNAAENLSEISELKLGEKIGYLVGMTTSGEVNKYDDELTDIIYATYGRVLATKEIMQADHIILDELHENTMDMAIAKALIKYRYKNGFPPITLILMSASLNAETESSYWMDVAPIRVFSADTGHKFDCTIVHEPATAPEQAALSLIDEGYRGILVFAAGVGECQDIIKKLNQDIIHQQRNNITVELIHGQSEYSDRQRAFAAPEDGCCKILVGTDVMESGMSLSWVDAGVTTGEKKEMYIRESSGAAVLALVPLVKTNVDQRSGRTNRFQNSKFIICGPKSYDEMTSTTTPEILRLPLTSLYMHCEAIGINPEHLDFMPQPDINKLHDAAQKLKILGFFTNDLHFTPEGRIANELPIGLETSALLCHAHKLGILADALILAAVYEVGSLRKEHDFEHYFDETSDYFDAACAYVYAQDIRNDRALTREARIKLLEDRNVSMKRCNDVYLILQALEQKCSVKADFSVYRRERDYQKLTDRFAKLRQCLIAASLCNMGSMQRGIRQNEFLIGSAIKVQVSRSTVIGLSPVASAKLRVITPKNGTTPFTIAEKMTQYTIQDLLEFNKIRPNTFLRVEDPDGTRIYLNGLVLYFEKRRDESMRDLHHSSYRRNDVKPFISTQIETVDEKPRGTLADILQTALAKHKSANIS